VERRKRSKAQVCESYKDTGDTRNQDSMRHASSGQMLETAAYGQPTANARSGKRTLRTTSGRVGRVQSKFGIIKLSEEGGAYLVAAHTASGETRRGITFYDLEPERNRFS
jgi:hypothetical protein